MSYENMIDADQSIRFYRCDPSDVEVLQEIAYQTYDDAFRDLNSAETMKAYLQAAFSKHKLSEELRNSASRFYFVYDGELLVGYMKVNEAPAQTDIQDPDALELERIYVGKKWQGKGIGRKQIEKVMEIARSLNKKYVWLGVWEKNEKAIRFYQHLGFKKFSSHIFVMGEEKQTDIIMKKEVG